jgi:hypothetical protein
MNAIILAEALAVIVTALSVQARDTVPVGTFLVAVDLASRPWCSTPISGDPLTWLICQVAARSLSRRVHPSRGNAPGLNYLGLQAETPEELLSLCDQAGAADGATLHEASALCCHAVSDMHWTVDPKASTGNRSITWLRPRSSAPRARQPRLPAAFRCTEPRPDSYRRAHP